MSNWLIYSPVSKYSVWGKITDQMNRSNVKSTLPSKTLEYYQMINDSAESRGMFISHWSRGDSQFELTIHPKTQELTAIRPSAVNLADNNFSRTIDTERIKKWLEKYEWVGLGYLIAPEVTDRFSAMRRSLYFTRDADSNFLLLEDGTILSDGVNQPIQTWFTVSKATDNLYVIHCHPDVTIPGFDIEYRQDKFDNTFYTHLNEQFDYFEIGLKPQFNNSTLLGETIWSTDNEIDIIWGQGSYLASNTLLELRYPKPDEIITDLEYTTTSDGINIINNRGILTLRYKVSRFLSPSIHVNETGIIEKTYLILGI